MKNILCFGTFPFNDTRAGLHRHVKSYREADGSREYGAVKVISLDVHSVHALAIGGVKPEWVERGERRLCRIARLLPRY